MKIQRKMPIVSALALAVLVLAVAPGLAVKPPAAKTIGMHVTPPTAASNTETTFTVTLYNTTPGNSNPNSFLITLPDGYDIQATTSAEYVSGTTTNANRVVASDPTAETVSVTGLDPLKSRNGAGPTVVIAVTATTPAIGTCGSSEVGEWTVVGYTGSNLTGDTFTRVDTTFNGNVITTASLTCELAFDPAPANGVINANISTTVKVTGGTSTGNITLAVTSEPSGAVTTVSSPAPSPASFTVTGDTVGSYTVTASKAGLSPISASFQLFAAGINCQGTSGGVEGGEPATTATLNRTDNGPNGDGTGCVQVPYTLTPTADTVVLLKDQAVVDQQKATFELVITWGTAPGDYGSFKVSVFDPDGIEGNADDYTPANCSVSGGVAEPPLATATEHWCFAGLTIVPVGDDFAAQETYLGSGDPTIRYK